MNRKLKPPLVLFGLLPLLISCERIFDNINNSEGSLHRIFDLPNELSESSGLIIYNSLLWTFNDGENGVTLYGLDISNGAIVKIIHIQNAENVDWEGISQDENKIFIGDIGNISGDRDSLQIYILNKADITNSFEQQCTANKINFVFGDQHNYNPNYHATSYDCEALISLGDSLYVFTKNWVSSNSVLYSLPKIPGSYSASRIVSINSGGMVTGAGFNPEEQQIALCGYEGFTPFILLVDVSAGLNIDDQMISRFEFIEHMGIQIEGIDYSEEKIYLISENSALPQAFFEFRQN